MSVNLALFHSVPSIGNKKKNRSSGTYVPSAAVAPPGASRASFPVSWDNDKDNDNEQQSKTEVATVNFMVLAVSIRHSDRRPRLDLLQLHPTGTCREVMIPLIALE